MPLYANNPFTPPQLVQKGVPAYLLGTYNFHQANTKMQVSNSALTSNVATVTGQIVEGEVPLVGSYISISQTQAGTGAFNVSRAIVTAVSFNNSGFGTVTFALTHANVTSVADTGTAIVEVPEVGETMVPGMSIACCMQAPEGDSQFTVPFALTFPSGTLPTAVTGTLMRSIRNIQSEFTATTAIVTIAASAYTTGPVVQATLERGYFYAVNISGITGTGVVVAKVGG